MILPLTTSCPDLEGSLEVQEAPAYTLGNRLLERSWIHCHGPKMRDVTLVRDKDMEESSQAHSCLMNTLSSSTVVTAPFTWCSCAHETTREDAPNPSKNSFTREDTRMYLTACQISKIQSMCCGIKDKTPCSKVISNVNLDSWNYGRLYNCDFIRVLMMQQRASSDHL